MKKFVVIFLMLLTCIFMISCAESHYDKMSDDTISNTSINQSTQEAQLSPIGGSAPCSVHHWSYHYYPLHIINYVGETEFNKWLAQTEEESKNAKQDCNYSLSNISSFIRYFKISKDTVIEWYNLEILDWYNNIDLLYSGTPEQVDKYYRNYTEAIYIESYKKQTFDGLKMDIITNNTDIFGMTTRYSDHSLIELMMRAGYKDIKEVKAIGNYERGYEFDYNENILSSFAEKSIDEIIEKYTPYYLDCLVCGVTPYNTPYERQVALNAEKDQ